MSTCAGQFTPYVHVVARIYLASVLSFAVLALFLATLIYQISLINALLSGHPSSLLVPPLRGNLACTLFHCIIVPAMYA